MHAKRGAYVALVLLKQSSIRDRVDTAFHIRTSIDPRSYYYKDSVPFINFKIENQNRFRCAMYASYMLIE